MIRHHLFTQYSFLAMFIKNKSFWLVLLSLSVSGHFFGQTVGHTKEKDVVFIKGLYKGYGKVFNTTQNTMLEHLHIDHGFLPTDQDILLTEQLMQQGYPELVQTDSRLKGSPTDFRGSFYDYYRQYCGIVTKTGERVVFLMLFKCCKSNIRHCFPSWKDGLVTPLREDTCSIISWFDVNLTKNRISLP